MEECACVGRRRAIPRRIGARKSRAHVGRSVRVSVLDFNCVVDQLSTACAPTPVYGVRIGKGRKVFGPASGEAQRALP